MAGSLLGRSTQIFSEVFEKLSFSDSTCVGLSIGSSSIKIVELKKTGRDWKLLHFGIAQLPDNSIQNQEIINPVGVTETLKNLSSQMKLKSKKVCMGISGSSLVVKRILMDIPNMKEFEDQVFWEAEQYLPYEITEMVVDYHILNKSKDNHVDIMLVAAKSSNLEMYKNCIIDSGLNPKIIDADFFALINIFEANYSASPSEAVILVDIGASSLKTVVVQNGISAFTKETTLGGKNLTLEIQKQMNLPFTDAEMLKQGGASGVIPQEVSDLISISNENYGNEIKKSIDFYNASSAGAAVSAVFLSGGASKADQLSKTVEEIVGLPTQIMNPFNSITYDQSVFSPEYIAAVGPIAAVPIGLAIRMGAK